MSERIAAEFCRVTRTDFSRILQKRIKEVDTKLLLHSIQKTTAFESLLSRRFLGLTIFSFFLIFLFAGTLTFFFLGKTLHLSSNYDPANNPFEETGTIDSQNYQSITSQPFK